MIHSHLDLLEASFDGAIPPAALAAARDRDRLGEPLPSWVGSAADRLAASPLKRRFRDDDHAVSLMARLMADRAAAMDSCGETDLACAGFTGAEITRFGERARARAATILADRGAR